MTGDADGYRTRAINDLYKLPAPKWLWWEFDPVDRNAAESVANPLRRWRGVAVPEAVRAAIARLAQASVDWSCRASIDVDVATRASLKSLRDEASKPALLTAGAAPCFTLEETLLAVANIRRGRARFEVCADSARKPPHLRAPRRGAAADDDE